MDNNEFHCPSCGVVMKDHALRVSVASQWTCRCGYSEPVEPSSDSVEVKNALFGAIFGNNLPKS